MKQLMSVLAFGLVSVVATYAVLPASASQATDEHTEWIAKSLKEIESVKVGMSRVELLQVFKEEGGISTRTGGVMHTAIAHTSKLTWSSSRSVNWRIR